MKNHLPAAALMLLLVSCTGQLTPDKLPEALLKAVPGDTLIIAPGTYDGMELHLKAAGPVVVRPRIPGSAVFIGETALFISGEGLQLEGLLFRGAVTSEPAIVQFRDGRDYASGCRLTGCVFDSCNPARRDKNYSMVHLYGRNNRVDHCSILGRLNLGVSLVVRLTDEGCDENHHEIDHNYFGPRPVYGSNGAEAVQVGLAGQCMQSCRSYLHDNLFYRCDGEVEVLSVKSSDNIVESNVFYECQGVLAIRHGDRNIARGNVFVGNGKVNTGGIRVVGEDQILENNRFHGLRGRRFFAPLALMCGVPNCLPNRYMQVKRTIITGNVWSDCTPLEFDTGLDLERTLLPEATVFRDNVVTPEPMQAPSLASLSEGKGADWYAASSEALPLEVIELKDSTYVLDKPMKICRPTVIKAAPGTHPVIRYEGKSSGNMITICDNGTLEIHGIAFDASKAPGKSGANFCICTDKDMITPYSLVAEDCSFSNLGGIGQYAICGLKGTMADSVLVRRCDFSASSGGSIFFAGEGDDKGKYNCELLLVEDCCFSRIAEVAVNIYRGGCDESTAGPRMVVRRTVFDDCSNKVRSCAIRAIGVQDLLVEDCEFRHTGRGSYSIRLDDAPWEKIVMRRNTFPESGRIDSNRNI